MGPNRDADRPQVRPSWLGESQPLGVDDLSIRSGGVGDLDAVCEIESLAHPTPWDAGIFERELDLDWSHLWVVQSCRDARLVAFLVFWTVHDEVHILNVAVHPDHRRCGIATAIIDSLGSRARERDFAFMTLEVREHNEPAIRLYESMGFEVAGAREGYYADTGEAAMLMHHLI